MKEMLVDEPFLDNVVAAEKRDIGRVDHQQAARLQHAPMVVQRRARMRPDARWCGRNERCRSGRVSSACLRCAHWISSVRCKLGAGIGIRAHRARPRPVGAAAPRRETPRETAAVGADIQQREWRVEIDMARAAHPSPPGCESLCRSGHCPNRRRSRRRHGARVRAVDARQALHQPAMAAEIDFQSAGGTLRLIDDVERRRAAKIARIRSWNVPGKIR